MLTGFNSDFREHRLPHTSFSRWCYDFHTHRNSTPVTEDIVYDKQFHDSSDMAPEQLSRAHITALQHYTSVASSEKHGYASSGNINAYLRNRSGEKENNIVGLHRPEKVLSAVRALSSAFMPRNTNRKTITTYGAVPPLVGNKIGNYTIGKTHSVPGFISTTSDPLVADAFCHKYHGESPANSRVDHVVVYNIAPGAALSVARHSNYPEDEVLIHHGALITRTKTEHKTRRNGMELHIHHFDVSPTHVSLDNYGKYEHPED